MRLYANVALIALKLCYFFRERGRRRHKTKNIYTKYDINFLFIKWKLTIKWQWLPTIYDQLNLIFFKGFVNSFTKCSFNNCKFCSCSRNLLSWFSCSSGSKFTILSSPNCEQSNPHWCVNDFSFSNPVSIFYFAPSIYLLMWSLILWLSYGGVLKLNEHDSENLFSRCCK